ncbi:MAG: PKD domain-containing protein [Bacteroidetes bacterium]|nr:PKD domain-containing protein [Bacteroidota bacterium]
MKKLILLFSVFFCMNANAAVTFTVNKTIGCSPLVVRYIDVTVHPFPVVSRTWTFGNSFPPLSGGDTMTTFYDSVKCFSPKLKVCYSNGTCDSTTNTSMVCVSSLPILSFRAIDSLGCMKSGGSHTVNLPIRLSLHVEQLISCLQN